MPLYEFRFADGTTAERFYPLSKRPALGACVRIDGRRAVRVMSQTRLCVPDVQHEACNMLSLRHGRDPDVPRYSPEGVKGLVGGFPLFKNRREIKNYEAKKAAQGSKLRYDP